MGQDSVDELLEGRDSDSGDSGSDFLHPSEAILLGIAPDPRDAVHPNSRVLREGLGDRVQSWANLEDEVAYGARHVMVDAMEVIDPVRPGTSFLSTLASIRWETCGWSATSHG